MHKPYDEKIMIGYDRLLRVKDLVNSGVFQRPSSQIKSNLESKLLYKLISLNKNDFEKVKNIITESLQKNIEKEKILQKIDLFLKDTEFLLKEEADKKQINFKELYNLEGSYIEKSSSSSKDWSKYYLNSPLTLDKKNFLESFNIYKVYASFDKLENLTKENIEKILNDLGNLGFRGAFKVIGNDSRLSSSDQMCFYSSCPCEQKLAYEYLRNLENINEISCGIDTSYSFSELLTYGTFFNKITDVPYSNQQELIKEFINCIDIESLVFERKLNEENLDKATEIMLQSLEDKDEITWFFEDISYKQDLSEQYINKYKEYLKDLESINKDVKKNNLQDFNYLEENKESLPWKQIFTKENLSLEVLKKYKKYSETFGIDIAKNSFITKDIVDLFKDEINFYFLSKNSNLSENIVKEYKNLLDLESVSKFAKLSNNFIRENIEDLNITALLTNKNINVEDKRILRNEFSKFFELESLIEFERGEKENFLETLVISDIDNFTKNQLTRIPDFFKETSILNKTQEYIQLKQNYNLLEIKEGLLNKQIKLKDLPEEICKNKLFIGNLILSENFELKELPKEFKKDEFLKQLDEYKNKKEKQVISLNE